MADFESNILKRKAVAAIVLATIFDETGDRGWKRGKTREWMKRREERGYCSTIVRELQIEDTASYKEMMRVEHAQFLEILNMIEKDITPQQILGGHKVISPMSRLTLTLRFLATGKFVVRSYEMLGEMLDEAVKRFQHSIQHFKTKFVFDLDQTSSNISFQCWMTQHWWSNASNISSNISFLHVG